MMAAAGGTDIFHVAIFLWLVVPLPPSTPKSSVPVKVISFNVSTFGV